MNVFRMLKTILGGLRAILRAMPMRLLELFGQCFPENSWGCRIRGAFYRPFLKSCGRNFQVGLMAKIESPKNVAVENDVYIGHGCWINGARAGVTMESEVMLGPYVAMVAGDHAFENGSARFSRRGPQRPIKIGFGTWVASHAVIASGVTIGKGCLVAAGAVVTRDVPEGKIVGGVPAHEIGEVSNLRTEVEEGQ